MGEYVVATFKISPNSLLSWGFFFNLFFMRLCLLFAFFLSFAPSSFAGNGDTLQLPKAKNSITYFYLNQFEKSDRLNFVDNSLYNFQNSVPRSNLGNIGLAFNDFIYQPFLPDLAPRQGDGHERFSSRDGTGDGACCLRE